MTLISVLTMDNMKNEDLFTLLRSNGIQLTDHVSLLNILLAQYNIVLSEDMTKNVLESFRRYCRTLHKKWTACNYTLEYFNRHESGWLSTQFSWPVCFVNEVRAQTPSTSKKEPQKTKVKLFEDLSMKQKRRRAEKLRSESCPEELKFAAKLQLRSEGNKELEKILDHLLNNPEDIQKVSDFLFRPSRNKKPVVNSENSLALMTSINLSTWNYRILRQFLNTNMESCVLPSYYKIQKEKESCYPPKEEIIITETMAKIPLQALLDLTAKRLLTCHGTKLENINLTLVSKWGCDGASNQSQYKQKFNELISSDQNESSIFMTSLVPLRLVTEENIVVWENPSPSSTRYCRPIKFQFIKESSVTVKNEVTEMETEIQNLVVTTADNSVLIRHDLLMTMIDGKIRTIISDTPSSSTCPICLAKPSELNELDRVTKKPVREDIYKYGFSSLHMWIRCMEYLLHVAYNMEFKTWIAKGDNKTLKEQRKKKIQDDFRNELGIIVDVVKQGVGTSNDGNTARAFFHNYEISATVTGLDTNLIYRFAVILQAISSNKKLNIEKLKQYLLNTAEYCIFLYKWYYMPSSVHILLIHGAAICQHFSFIPIGTLSEEASEARNKEFRNFREHFSRKTSRKHNIEDILHRLLVSSDPVISHIRPKYDSKKKMNMFPEAVELMEEDEEKEEEDSD